MISTQQHLDIEDIRDNLVILKNGSVALVMETNAVNFDLLSEEEQDVKIFSFAALINSLTFPIQIVVHTERTDITKYVERLKTIQSKQVSAGLARQIEIYIKFIKNLTQNNEILDKRFFVVVPAHLGAIEKPSFLKSLFGRSSQVTINIDKILAKAQIELYPKRDHLINQFKRIGLDIKQLNTDELIHLYYSLYDPDKAGFRDPSIDKEDYTAGIVTSTLKQ